jgi:hypothetical protein
MWQYLDNFGFRKYVIVLHSSENVRFPSGAVSQTLQSGK